MHKDTVTKITYGPGMVHDLSSLTLDSIEVGPSDIVDAQGIQLEERVVVEQKITHPLFGIAPTIAYHETLFSQTPESPFVFTIEGLSEYSSLHLTLTIEPHTTVKIVERVSGKIFVTAHILLYIGDGAQVTYTREDSSNMPNHTAIYREAVVQKHASITWYDTVQKEKECTYETVTRLVGEGAEGKTYGVILGKMAQLLDTFHHTIHESPYTVSHTDIRVVLGDEAKHLGRTKTTILPHAHHVQAREEMHTILLSDKAKSQTVPDLDIQENDVACSHAVTTTRLSPDKLFYLSARGIEERQAKLLALEAHIAPSVQSTENSSEFIINFLAYE